MSIYHTGPFFETQTSIA